MCYAHLRALSSLSETSGAAQVYGNWGIVEMLGSIGGVVALEVVLIIPLLSLFWYESPHLVVVSFSEDLIDGLLGDNAVNCSLL